MSRKIKLKIIAISCVGVLGGVCAVQAHYIRKLEEDYEELKSTYGKLWHMGSYFLQMLEDSDIDLTEFDRIALNELGNSINEE